MIGLGNFILWTVIGTFAAFCLFILVLLARVMLRRNARSYPILQQTQVAIESLLPMNPEQYLPQKPEEAPGGGQPEGAPEAPAEGAPAQPGQRS